MGDIPNLTLALRSQNALPRSTPVLAVYIYIYIHTYIYIYYIDLLYIML